jgi:hypothetical protein
MKHSTQWIRTAGAITWLAALAVGAQAQIGIAASAGTFTIAGVKSTGTATVFNGDALTTDGVASRVHLSNGTDLMMAPHSTGAIFSDHINLTAGTVSGQIDGRYRVVTTGLVILPRDAKTEAQVQVANNRVAVAIPKGNADIATTQGTLVAHMMPGNAMNYQAVGNDTAVQAVGVLNQQDGHYLIRDRFTNVVSELSGNIPASYVDKLVRVTGDLSTTSSNVKQVDRLIMVKQIKRSDATSSVPCEKDPGGSVAKEMAVNGVLSQEEGHYLVSTSDHGIVEVMGNVDQSSIGKTVHMNGSIVTGQTAYAPAEQLVYTEKRKFVFSDSPCAGLITGGMLITAGMLIHPGDGSSAIHNNVTPVSF